MQTNRTCIISVMWMTFLFSFWSYACIYSEWVKLKLSFCNLYNKCYPTEHGSVLKISMWDCLWFSYNISIDKREKIEGMWWKPCNCHNSERALWSLTMFLLVENESSYQFSNLNVHVILMWITFWMWTWLVDKNFFQLGFCYFSYMMGLDGYWWTKKRRKSWPLCYFKGFIALLMCIYEMKN